MSSRTLSSVHILLISLVLCLIGGYLLFSVYRSTYNETKQLTPTGYNFDRLIEINKRTIGPFYLPILLYHYVEIVTDDRDTIRQSLSITPKNFTDQIDTLIAAGYTPIVFNDITSYFRGGNKLPPKPVILTFDDGYRDFYTDVLPIIRKYQIPVVLYMVSGFLDTTLNYLTTEQLLEISKSGLVEINSHGVNHIRLDYLDETRARYEIMQSKHDLEKLLKKPVRHFAYPYGIYNEWLIKEVEKAGYVTAATVDDGLLQTYANRFMMMRIHPGRESGESFLNRLKVPLD